MIIGAFWIAFLLLIWYQTNFFYEYARLFFKDFFLNYEKMIDSFPLYIDYLRDKYSNYFIIRLLGCQICLSFWLSVLYSIIFLDFSALAVIMLGGLIIYFVVSWLYLRYENL